MTGPSGQHGERSRIPRIHANIQSVQFSERLLRAVQQARRYGGDLPTPTNEANTCHWIIHPLLLSLGYENHEVMAQAFDVSGRYPDYTVLPDSQYSWYVEAKSWSVRLDNTHVDQALNYAHQNGRRWVVLTNGKTWRLYDDRIHGISAARLVAQSNLADDDFLPFIDALSRESVVRDGVSRYVAALAVRKTLRAEFADPSGSIVRAIVRELRRLLPGSDVIPTDVCQVVSELSRPASQEPTVLQCSPPDMVVQAETPGASPQTISGPILVKFSIKNLQGIARFENPATVLLPGCQLRRALRNSARAEIEPKLEALLEQGRIAAREDHYEVLEEIHFRSPSGASDLVAGGATNGWVSWRDEQGQPIQVYRRLK